MKSMVLAVVSVVVIGTFNSVQAGEMCEEISYLKEVAWDIEYEYRKKCYYETEYSYVNLAGNPIVAFGNASAHTSWSSNNSYNCPNTINGTVFHQNGVGLTVNKIEPIPFSYSSSEQKEVSRIATAWEHYEIWRDRYGNPCTPYMNN
ncbi:MAG: hypothetical protein ACJAV1_002519 [Paraglaciecola sp.]|jgi:hypothetical protein